MKHFISRDNSSSSIGMADSNMLSSSSKLKGSNFMVCQLADNSDLVRSFKNARRYSKNARRYSVLVFSTLLVAACGGKKTEEVKDENQIVVGAQDVESARTMDVVSGIVLSGPLDPAQIVKIKAQVGGTVRNVRVDRGMAVKAGQSLANIEALGVLSQAASAKAGVAAREAGLALAKQRLDAAKTLFDAGAMSAIDYRGAQATYEAAEAELAAAKAASSAAGEQAARSSVLSPITGYVSERFVEGGEAVMPDAPLFTVVNSDELELAGQIPVAYANGVKVGQPVVFTLDGMPGKEYTGRVARIDPTADMQTRQVRVYVRLNNPRGAIVGGQFARGRIVGQKVPNVVTVPAIAVRKSGDATTVFVIENGVVAVRDVEIGLTDEASGRVAVLSGLSDGEQVIVAPALTLTPGTKVVTGNSRVATSPAEDSVQDAPKSEPAKSE